MLQSIAGHHNSALYPFWQQLGFLQHCTELLGLSPDKLANAVISEEAKTFEFIYREIQSVLKDLSKPRKHRAENKVTLTALLQGFSNIKGSSFIDKLWRIVVCE